MILAVLLVASQLSCPPFIVELKKHHTVEEIETTARQMGVPEPTIQQYKRACALRG